MYEKIIAIQVQIWLHDYNWTIVTIYFQYYKFWVLQLKFSCMGHMQLQICVVA
jgi:hypothetical protein